MEVFHDTATECHLPYGITQSYLLPDTSEHTVSCRDSSSTSLSAMFTSGTRTFHYRRRQPAPENGVDLWRCYPEGVSWVGY